MAPPHPGCCGWRLVQGNLLQKIFSLRRRGRPIPGERHGPAPRGQQDAMSCVLAQVSSRTTGLLVLQCIIVRVCINSGLHFTICKHWALLLCIRFNNVECN